MTSVVVLGANGFLGSHLVDALVNQGHDVTVFDRFGHDDHAFDARRVSVVSGDFMNSGDVATAIEGSTQVVHALSTTSPATAANDPSVDLATNVAPTVVLLQRCVEAGVKRVHFLSSGGAIYGPQEHRPHVEDDPALPVSPYGIGKLAIERFLEYFRLTQGLDYAVYRVSNPFGPRQRPSRRQGLIPIALRAIRDGMPVARMGDGSMVRDYVFVEDVSAALAPLMDKKLEHRLYNVGSGSGTTVSQVLETLREVTRVNFDIEEFAVPSTFVDYAVLDVTRFASEHGQISRTNLAHGIARTWEAIRTE